MIRAFALAIAFHVLHAVFFHVGLPAPALVRPVLAVAASREIPFLVALGLAVPLFVAYRRIRWADLESGAALRVFVLAIAFVPAWQLSTYAPNLFLGRMHAVDRLLVVALWLAIALHPAFVVPFLAQATLVLAQFQTPLGEDLVYDLLPILDVLALVVAFAYARAFWRERVATFVAVCAALVASKYLVPGVSKLAAGWIVHDDPANLFLASWRNGWLSSMHEASAIRFARTIHSVRLPLVVAVQAIELGAIAIGASRRASRIVLASFVVLHLGTCVFLGDPFWKWIWLAVALLALLVRLDADTEAVLYGARSRVSTLALLLASPLLFIPQRLTWCDTGLVSTFDLEAVGASGRAHAIGRADMVPFEYVFSVNAFSYLAPGRSLTGTYGSTHDCRLADAIAKAGIRGIERLRSRKGIWSADPNRAARFDDFVRTYFSRRNPHRGALPWWTALSPPRVVWTAHREPARARRDPIRTIRVRHRETYFDGRRLHRLRDEIVRTIAIPN